MKEADDWSRELELKLTIKQSISPKKFIDFVESILAGKEIEPVSILILPEGWDHQFSELIHAAGLQGNTRRQKELEALYSLFRFLNILSSGSSENLKANAENIRELSYKSDSPVLQSFVLGTLGTTLNNYGFIQESSQFTKEAIEAARREGLNLAELQWSVNLALFNMYETPQETDQELHRLLRMARTSGDEKRIGMILNNLAVLNERFLLNLNEAIRFQEEAVGIARQMDDKVSELKRIFHLAYMQEQAGQVQSALKNYDRGLALEAFFGISGIGFRVFRHVSQLIANQYMDKTKEISSHFRISKSSLSEEEILDLLEESKMGQIMSSCDPSSGSIYFKPDNSFANKLSVHKEWEALALYAYQWMEHGFLYGDEHGFYWLSVAFRNLGYAGIADAALQIGMEFPRLFKKEPKTKEK